MEKTFVKAVSLFFDYLIRDYNYKILSSIESPRGFYWEGEVIYATEATLVHIECTRGEVPSFQIGRTKDIDTKDKRNYLLHLHLIYEYMVTTDDEKRIITSPGEQEQASNILHREKNISREIPQHDDPKKARERELEAYAMLMKRYAEPFLLGDFSQWHDIWKYSVEKNIASWIKPSTRGFSKFAAMDKSGKQKIYGKQEFYENPSEYLEQLRQNVYKDSLGYIKQLEDELQQQS